MYMYILDYSRKTDRNVDFSKLTCRIISDVFRDHSHLFVLESMVGCRICVGGSRMCVLGKSQLF